MTKIKPGRPKQPPKGATIDDFWAIASENAYLYTPTGDLWDSAVVNAILGSGATVALMKDKRCAQLTWAPGMPRVIEGRVIVKGAWMDVPTARAYNTYLPPPTPKGDANQAGPWLDLGYKIFGEQFDHIKLWLAHRVQRPEIKINHALVLGSANQGIGKDTLLTGARYAAGEWNCNDQGARQVMTKVRSGHDSFLESVILVISEVHDLGDARFAFYDLTKPWLASPPPTLSVSDKWVKQHPIMNLVGVIYTTNHLTDGLYLPAEDRRHFVAWSDIKQTDFAEGFWTEFYQWYADGGLDHVAAYLATLDVSAFNPKAEPEKTEAFWTIVQSNISVEDSEMADTLDALAWPDERPAALTIDMLAAQASGTAPELCKFLSDKSKGKSINHRLAKFGYTTVRNTAAKDGYWQIGGKAGNRRRIIYAVGSDRDAREIAARELVEKLNGTFNDDLIRRDAAEIAARQGVFPDDITIERQEALP